MPKSSTASAARTSASRVIGFTRSRALISAANIRFAAPDAGTNFPHRPTNRAASKARVNRAASPTPTCVIPSPGVHGPSNVTHAGGRAKNRS